MLHDAGQDHRSSARPMARKEALARLNQAMSAHRSGELDTAERLYRPLAAIPATRADALHYMGVLMHQRGQSEAGVAFLRQSLSLVPGHPDAHNNLGNILKESGDLVEAEDSYRRAVALSPAHPQALGNLAVVLEAREAHGEARAMYRHWLDTWPGDIRAHYLYGRFLCTHAERREDIETAIDVFRSGLAVQADHAGLMEALGMALYGLERIDEAADVYRQWSERDPAHPVPRHMLAACGVIDAPARADDAYIAHIFDRFAGSFDEQLVGHLAYRAPEALMAAIDALPARTSLDVLDAGCGTGLCGPLLRERARRLVGVDLSAAMIDKAAQRQCYDELHVAELVRHLDDASRYDLVVCADTLVYFGELDTFFHATHLALRDHGVLAFSLEALDHDDAPHRLMPSGRYRHAARYVRKALHLAGFDQVRIAPDQLRREAGHWVDGWIVTARRMSPGES